MREIRRLAHTLAPIFLITVSACSVEQHRPDAAARDVTVRVGFGPLPTTTPQYGMQEAVNRAVLELLVIPGRDGRAQPGLFDRWSVSADHLVWSFRLRQDATFHDGTKLDAREVEHVLLKQLPGILGPAFADVKKVTALSDAEVQISLRQPSAFLIEALDTPVQKSGAGLVGTGPFMLESSSDADMGLLLRVNLGYNPRPPIDNVELMPYPSARSAWADLLRGRIDMLYEVPFDALASLEPSTNVTVRRMRHSYQYMLILNVRRPALSSAKFRRELNSAVDRRALITSGLDGNATEANGPVWPEHWAYDPNVGLGQYNPHRLAEDNRTITLSCIFGIDPSRERLALALQKQLDAVGVHLELEALQPNEVLARLASGDFDTVLSDFAQGPNLFRPYFFWHAGGPGNFGSYESSAVDAALDSVRHATSDEKYKEGVVSFQQAIANDPPAIFLAWGERIRAVSKRFLVPDTGDPWGPNLRLWRPAGDAAMMSTTN